MLAEALDYLYHKFTEANEIKTAVINDDIYSKTKLNLIRPYYPKCEKLVVHSLTMLVEMVKHELSENHALPLIVSIRDNEFVRVYSALDQNSDRELILECSAVTPNIPFGLAVSPEQMIIQLLTNFEQTENCTNLQALLSSIVVDQKVEVSDDGFSQKVTTQNGAQIKNTVTINPLVRLTPFRTFRECEQPTQMFLIRLREDGNVYLIDADGGSYLKHCMDNIRGYLITALAEEIEEGKVIVG